MEVHGIPGWEDDPAWDGGQGVGGKLMVGVDLGGKLEVGLDLGGDCGS